MILIHNRPLPPTKTYPKPGQRHYSLTGPAGDYWARATIVQRKDIDVYFLEQFPDDSLPRGWRAVFFARQTGQVTDDRSGFYRVAVDHHGIAVACTCKGSVCQRQTGPCKHKDTVTDLLALGALPAVNLEPVGVG